MRVAVIGATGTAGSRTVARLKARGATPVELSRSTGVDLITGNGLREALEGVDVAIDASNAFPPNDTVGLHEALTSATRNVVGACTSAGVGHLVLLSVSGIDNPAFDTFPYYVAKRAQAEIVAGAPVPSSTVKSTQWYEFATNPAAVTFGADEVVVEDWLIQPVAVSAVAGVLVETALDRAPSATISITGPQVIRLPELTTRFLLRHRDARRVRAVAPPLTALAEGVLLAPDHAAVIGPDIEEWLATLPPST